MKLNKAALTAGLVGLLAAPALATPPTMSAVAFPIDTAAIVSAVVTAGAAILILIFGVKVGFKMVWKLLNRTTKAV